ncbi:type IV secretion system protein [Stenotrophomonas sp. T8]|uniref:type IV secretion system protein n=1 Tax=Stenotrophomonas sp. T8 TaxID=3446365 RepID=UPI003F71B480
MCGAALIVTVATSIAMSSMAMFGSNLQKFLNEDVKGLITHVVTGKDQQPEDQIDKSLAWMQVALSSIDGIKILNDPGLQADKTRALWFIGLGTGGPAVTAGAMLLLYEVALALFIGLGPLFILCLLFDQTKQLFQRWLFYGIGTMFSMAVLAAMVSIALDMVIRVSTAFWSTALVNKFLLEGASSDGMTSQAMQQGGMGLILTTLILTAPPMAAMFFQGTLGGFAPYSQIGGSAAGQPGPQGQPPGSYTPAQTVNSHSTSSGSQVDTVQQNMTRTVGAVSEAGVSNSNGRKLGNAD